MNAKEPREEKRKNIFVRFVLYLFRSVLLSALIIVLFFSFLTQEFPPNFAKIAQAYTSVKKILAYSAARLENPEAVEQIENDIMRLQEIQANRMREAKKMEELLQESRRFSDQIKSLTSPTNSQELVNLKSKVQILLDRQKTLEDRLVQIERKLK